MVDLGGEAFALCFCFFALPADVSRGNGHGDEQGNEDGGGSLSRSHAVALRLLVHVDDGAGGDGDIGSSRDVARRRRGVCGGKDGTSRQLRGLEGRLASRDDAELEMDGGGRVPPAWQQIDGNRASGEIDVLPDCEARPGGRGGVEIDVGLCGVEAAVVPLDVERLKGVHRLLVRRCLVECARSAGWGQGLAHY